MSEVAHIGNIIAPNKGGLINGNWTHYWDDPKEEVYIAMHWVVVTGFSTPWVYNEDGSPGNWVRIMNPYYNREEYYPWSLFKKSMIDAASGPYLLEVWADKLTVFSKCP